MKAQELRIGNLFIDEKSKTIISVIGLTEQIITFSGHFKNDWQAKPIPLTEDWLRKLGVKDSVWVFELFNNGGEFHISTENGDWIFINYVHQLQNLYFALTGDELSIKD